MNDLSKLNAGDQAVVVSIDTTKGSFRQKILAFGMLPNSIVKVVRLAPLGDPLQIQVAAVNFSISKNEATQIIVEKI